jgi:chromosome segregation ATPase
MSLFKERVASSKRIVALENEIISLKQQLTSNRAASQGTKNIASLKDAIAKLQSDYDKCKAELLDSQNLFEVAIQEMADLKSDLKKIRSENTRLKKKLKAPEVSDLNVEQD